jgi:hypothetical protein
VAAGFVEGRDRYINQGTLDPNITDADITVVNSPVVVVTSGVFGGNADGSVLPSGSFEIDIYAAATLVFSIVDEIPIALPEREFADCEAVACAGLPTGEYNIQGTVRFCDNGAAGGGWVRLWSVNESACETKGWTSARSPWTIGTDPIGCRPGMTNGCKSMTIQSPFAFNEVRGDSWSAWGAGSLGAFHSQSPDGIRIVGNDTHIWTFAASAGLSNGLCPCDSAFIRTPLADKNLNASGTDWTCDRLPTSSVVWKPLFTADAITCVGYAAMSGNGRFQRTVPSLTTLSVAICKNGNGSLEDVKLSSGDLYVRSTAGFDRRRCGLASTTASTLTSLVSLAPPRTEKSDGSSLSTSSVSSMATLPPSASLPPSTGQSAASLFATTIFDVTVPLSDSRALFGGIIGGISGLFVLVALAASAIVCWRRRHPTNSPIAPQGEYGVLPASQAEQYSDVDDVRRAASDNESADRVP